MEKGETFFATLKTIASEIEKQVDEAKTKYDDKGDVCVPAILTSMYGVSKEVKQLKQQVKAPLNERKQHVDYLDNILTVGKLFIGKLSKELDEKEKYMQQYGYIVYDVKEEKKEEPQVEQEDNSISETTDSTAVVEPETPSSSRFKPTNVNRTPQMEDFGISQATLDLIKAMEKKQKVKQTTQDVVDLKQKPEETSKVRTDQTFCVISGNSVLSGKTKTDKKFTTNHVTSPKYDDVALPEQTTARVRQFDKKHSAVTSVVRGPQTVPDCFQHDGLMLTPSVFGREIDRSVLNIHESLASPVSLHCDNRDFQEEYDTSSTTKQFPRDLRAFPNLAAYSEIKENMSPKEPELLSQNTSHTLNGQKLEPRGKRSLFEDDLPQSPKLYGNYGFSSN